MERRQFNHGVLSTVIAWLARGAALASGITFARSTVPTLHPFPRNAPRWCGSTGNALLVDVLARRHFFCWFLLFADEFGYLSRIFFRLKHNSCSVHDMCTVDQIYLNCLKRSIKYISYSVTMSTSEHRVQRVFLLIDRRAFLAFNSTLLSRFDRKLHKVLSPCPVHILQFFL